MSITSNIELLDHRHDPQRSTQTAGDFSSAAR